MDEPAGTAAQESAVDETLSKTEIQLEREKLKLEQDRIQVERERLNAARERLQNEEQIRFTKIATGLDPKQFVKREGVHHNALDDSIFQARLSIQCTKIAMDVRDLMEQVKNGEIGHASDNS